MKVGFRTPSIKKSIRARTTGKLKRKMNKAINPFYGKKGMGFIKNPSRSIKNSLYHKTTFGVSDIARAGRSAHSKAPSAKGNTNGCLIALLIIFWPVGIIYLIYKAVSKNKASKSTSPQREQPALQYSQVSPANNAGANIYRETIGVMQQFTALPFDFVNVPYIYEQQQGQRRYLLEGRNLQQARMDIVNLNYYLKNAAEIMNNSIPTFVINDIRYTTENWGKGTVDFSQMFCTPFTETGKQSKYPLYIAFQSKPHSYNDFSASNIFGDVYYLQTGKIGKARIICWSQEGALFVIHLAEKVGNLVVNKIETSTNTGERIALYKYQ